MAGEEVVQMHALMKRGMFRPRAVPATPACSLGESWELQLADRRSPLPTAPIAFQNGRRGFIHPPRNRGADSDQPRSCRFQPPPLWQRTPTISVMKSTILAALPMAWIKIGVIDRYVYASQRRTCGCCLTYFTQLFPVQPAGLGIVHCR